VKYSTLILLGMMNLALAEPVAPVPPEPKPSALPAGLNVLIVGDSNTEIGHISGGLARRLEENFGFFGTWIVQNLIFQNWIFIFSVFGPQQLNIDPRPEFCPARRHEQIGSYFSAMSSLTFILDAIFVRSRLDA
jgi:hypothetical protein